MTQEFLEPLEIEFLVVPVVRPMNLFRARSLWGGITWRAIPSMVLLVSAMRSVTYDFAWRLLW